MSTDPLLRDTPGIGTGPDVDLLLAALAAERIGQQHLLHGEQQQATPYMRAAAAAYMASYPLAQPRSWGRLIGAIKAAVLAGDGRDEARRARSELGQACDTPPACYLGALCAVVLEDDATALRLTPGMRDGGPAFARAAEGIEAIARGDERALEQVTAAVEADFAARDAHLTGVPIADTALMLRRIATHRTENEKNR